MLVILHESVVILKKRCTGLSVSVNLPVCLCLAASLSLVCLSLSICLSVCVWLSASLWFVCLCQSACLSVSGCQPLSGLSVSVNLPVCLCLAVSLSLVCLSLSICLSVCVWLSASLSLSVSVCLSCRFTGILRMLLFLKKPIMKYVSYCCVCVHLTPNVCMCAVCSV